MNNRTPFRVPRSRAFDTHETLYDEIIQAMEQVVFGSMRHGYAIREQFERAFAQVVGQSYAVAVHSGTVGLFVALRACGIRSGDEVITVGNSDISTTAAVHHCGGVPVLCDVLESDYTLNVDLVEALITPHTKAILPVDLHGHPANVRRLREIANQHDVLIIEDAALAAGSNDYGKPLGAFADATIYSFAPIKPLGSVSNGAIVVTNDEKIYERLRLFTYYGHATHPNTVIPEGHQNYVDEGYNVPLDALQAALLSVKLPYLAEWTQKRRAIVQRYAEGLTGTSAILPTFRDESEPTFRSFTIRVPHRDELYKCLREAGIEVVLHYTPPIYQQPVYNHSLRGCDALSITDRLADELLCLPVTPELTDSEIDYAIETLRKNLD